MHDILENYLDCNIKQFEYYKSLGEKGMSQVPDEALFFKLSSESNSISIIVQHLWGNMISRWTNFLDSDGEKPTRDRDAEFEEHITSRDELMKIWNEGWDCLFTALRNLKTGDLNKTVFIRNMEHTVVEAIQRQLAHYAYHVGQIVYISKAVANENWKTLSIPKNQSKTYNEKKFAEGPHREHFTEEYMRRNDER
jgi:hypothetical protein